MKRKTNISVQDNRGVRRIPNMIVSEKHNGYLSGDILDAKAIVDLIKKFISEIDVDGIVSKIITTENIQDGTILLEDLSKEVTDKMETTYDEDEEKLYMNGSGVK